MLRSDIDETHEDSWMHDNKACDWREIDRNLRKIARRRAALDVDEARWLREAVRGEIWRELGAATMYEYLEDRLGYTPRVAMERVRVAVALAELPVMTEALSTGALPFTAIRELVRVATPATEVAWLEAARGKNVHQIEHAVSGRARGDLPDAPPRPELKLRSVRFDVRPETFARLREVQLALEAEAGMRLDDDALMAALCAAVLEPGEPARAQHQIHTIECARCGQGWQDGAGVRLAIDGAALSRAQCDAERVDPVTQRAKQDVPPKIRRVVWHRDSRHCTVPGCRSKRHLEIHHIVSRAQAGDHTEENLTLLCGAHHRALHDGRLTITGKAPALSFAFAHVGRGGDVASKVRAALVGMGFSQHEAAAAVERARERVGTSPTQEELLDAALQARTS